MAGGDIEALGGSGSDSDPLLTPKDLAAKHLAAELGASLHVSELSYYVKRSRPKSRVGCCGSGPRNGYTLVEGLHDVDRPILNEVSLDLQPGGMLAILGNSGSGKTSLLDCLGQRTVWGSRITGQAYLDGQPLTQAVFRSRGAYVMQDDTLLPCLTVRETLSYVLRLRLACSEDEHDRKLARVIRDLGLKAVEQNVVGGTDMRGISGGERRRVSIALQLLIEPGLLLLDEPTSGLDTNTAHHIIVLLAQLAASKRHTVVLSIHQPRSDMFPLFQQVMILARGTTTYCGPAVSLIEYFTKLGHPCPAYTNPLDQYVDVSSIDTRRTGTMQTTIAKIEELTEAFKKSEYAERIASACPVLGLPKSSGPATPVVKVANASASRPLTLRKVVVLASRMNMNLLRERTGMQMRAFQMLLFGILLFLFILRLRHNQRSIQDRSGVFYQVVSAPLFIGMLTVIALFPPLRSAMSREVRDGLYHTPVFMLAYLLHMLPFAIFSTALFSGAFYWGCGFYPDLEAFLGFTFVSFCSLVFGESLALVTLGIFDDPNLANSVAALVFSLTSLLSSGLLRNIESMPRWLQDASYIGAQKYASEILVAYEYPNLNLTCDLSNNTNAEPCRFPNGQAYLEVTFPNAVADLDRNFLSLAAYCVCFFAVAMVIFSVRSYFKRR